MRTCTRRRLTFYVSREVEREREKKKKITFDDFWRRTSPSCQLRIMTQRNGVNNVSRLGDTILLPLGWGWGSKGRRAAGTAEGGKANVYLHSVYQKISFFIIPFKACY